MTTQFGSRPDSPLAAYSRLKSLRARRHLVHHVMHQVQHQLKAIHLAFYLLLAKRKSTRQIFQAQDWLLRLLKDPEIVVPGAIVLGLSILAVFQIQERNAYQASRLRDYNPLPRKPSAPNDAESLYVALDPDARDIEPERVALEADFSEDGSFASFIPEITTGSTTALDSNPRPFSAPVAPLPPVPWPRPSFTYPYTTPVFQPVAQVSRTPGSPRPPAESATQRSLTAKWSDLKNHWSAPYVQALADAGLVNGAANGKFEPDRFITRAELADLMQRSLPQTLMQQGEVTFTDVPDTHWAARSIHTAYRMGFFTDVSNGATFHPDQAASKIDAWGAIVSGLNLPSSRQHGALMQGWEASLPVGSQTLDHLEQPITRAEAIALLYQALQFRQTRSFPVVAAPVNPLDSALSARHNGTNLGPDRSQQAPRQVQAPEQTARAVNTTEAKPAATTDPQVDAILPPLGMTAPPLLTRDNGLAPVGRPQVESSSPEFTEVGSNPISHWLSEPEYRLAPGDRVSLNLEGLTVDQASYKVLADGTLTVPEVGRLVVTGMTLSEVQVLIYDRYHRQYQR